MPGLTEEAKRTHACVAELDKTFKTKASKVRAERRSVDMELVSEKERTERVKHMA